MGLLGNLDRLGARLFVPIVIWLCQHTGTTQARIYRYGWVFGAIANFYAVALYSPEWLWWAGSLTWVLVIWHGVHFEVEGSSSYVFRGLVVINELFHWGTHLAALFDPSIYDANFRWDTSCVFGSLVLLAEYATTVKTIPPLDKGEPARKVAKESA